MTLVPLLDQAVKAAVLDRLGRGSIPLGPIGELRAVQTQIWMQRAAHPFTLRAIWITWIAAAGGLAMFAALIPSSRWWAGLLLGGALSHALETSVRGSVCDYVCLRFWPAFDMADVAVTVGAGGLIIELLLFVARS